MLLWPALRKLKSPVLLLLGLMLAGMGLYLRYYVRVDHFWLIPLGVISPRFQSSDYYPLLPNLGYFLVGAFLGRRLYPDRTSLLPDMGNGPVGRALCFCGRNSLVIYMLHQPVLAALVGGWTWLFT